MHDAVPCRSLLAHTGCGGGIRRGLWPRPRNLQSRRPTPLRLLVLRLVLLMFVAKVGDAVELGQRLQLAKPGDGVH